MRKAHGLIICGVVFWASNLFAECNWVLWKSHSHINLAMVSAILNRQPMPQEAILENWEYLDTFRNKEECLLASSDKLNKFISSRNESLKKKIDEKKAEEKETEPSEIRVDKDGSVNIGAHTYRFKCIPITIDPRIKG